MAPIFSRQPLKLLFIIYISSKILLVKLPIWFLISLRRSHRPCPNWSVTKCLQVHFLRAMIGLPMGYNLFLQHRDLTVEVADSTLRDAKFVWVKGVDEENVQGEIGEYARRTGVKPARIPGYWQFKKGTATREIRPAGANEKVLYHLHGGGMSVGSAHPSDQTARIPRGILQHSTTISRTFAIDYRLSASAPNPPANPFPAALLDCIAGYQYLLSQGFEPQNIILAGDSAGGNLALALTRYLLVNAINGQQPPGKLLLLSPWTDMCMSRLGPTSSMSLNSDTDIFPVGPVKKGDFGSYGVASYIGSLGREELNTNMYLSPGSAYLPETEGMFKGFPITYISVGGAERLLDDARIIAERMKDDNAAVGWVTLDIAADAVHDFLMFLWAEPERSETLVKISKWVDNA